MYGQLNGWIKGWVDGWMDGWMGRWTDGQIDEYENTFIRASVRSVKFIGVCPYLKMCVIVSEFSVP